MLNRNIRCIEILEFVFASDTNEMLNRNIRCIEMVFFFSGFAFSFG